MVTCGFRTVHQRYCLLLPYNNMLLQSLSQREHKGHICVGEPNPFTQVFVISVSKNDRSMVIPLLLLNRTSDAGNPLRHNALVMWTAT